MASKSASSATAAGTSTVGYNNVADGLVTFHQGLDTNTDPFVLTPPYTTTATDVFYLSPGQVQALPVVYRDNALDVNLNVYAAGALPTYDPNMTGSLYEIAEVSGRLPYATAVTQVDPSYSPVLNIRNGTQQDPKGPIAPIYPYNTKTRTLQGTLPGYLANQVNNTSNPVSAVSRLLPNTVVTAVANLANTSNSPNPILVYVSDLTGSTTAQLTFNFGSASQLQDYRLIADNQNLGYYYLVVNETTPGPPSPTYNLRVYTIRLFPGTDPSTLQPGVFSSTVVTMASTSGAFSDFDVCYWNNVATLFTAVTATQNTGGAGVYYISLTPNLAAAPTMIFQAVTGFPSTVTGFAVNTSTDVGVANPAISSVNYVLIAVDGNVTVLPANLNAFTGPGTAFALPTGAVPVTIGCRPLATARADFTQWSASVFYHIVETFNNLTTQGWPTTTNTQYVQQVGCTMLRRTTAGGTFQTSTNYFRSIQGSQIISKCYPLNSFDVVNNARVPVGMASEMFLCPLVTGANDFDITPNGTQTAFVVDSACRVASRFNDQLVPVFRTNFTSNQFNPPYGLSQPLWFTNPNDGAIFEVGFPFIQLSVLQFNATPAPAPAAGSSAVVPDTPQANSGLINLFISGYQAQGAVAPIAQKGKAALLSGMLTMEYDGRTLHESGFHTPAKPIGPLTFTGSGGPFTNTQTAQYAVIYTWTDSTGARHLSNPSSLRYAQYNGNTTSTFFVQAPIATYKVGQSSPFSGSAGSVVQAEIYRTTLGDSSTVQYYIGTASMYMNNPNRTPNGSLSDFGGLFTDSNPGTLNPQLKAYPTAHAEYFSDPAPPFLWQVSSKGRAFGVACVAGTYRIYFSAQMADVNSATVQSEAPRWNFNGYVVCPAELGDIRSLGVIDDKIIVMGTRQLGVFTGDGPTLTPASGNPALLPTDLNYSPVTPIPATAGVVGCGSPFTTFKGLVYQDKQGMSLLDRGLSTNFIGKNIADTTNGVRYGLPMSYPSLQFVLFPNAQGPSLVMDYNSGFWSQWKSMGNSTAALIRADQTGFVLNGTITPATASLSNSQLAQIYPSGTTTPATPVAASNMVLETPWLPVGQGISGEGDMWEMVLLGKYFAPHTLTVETAFNYGAYTQTTTFQPGVDATLLTSPYQYRFRPLTMARMQSVRYRITVTNATTIGPTTCECARITGIMLYSGNYRGLQRTGAVVSR